MLTNTRLAAPAMLVVAVGFACADHYGYWNNHNDFYVRVTLMPDFDQRRDAGPGILGLPEDDDGEGGGMYCVPTSASDLLGYVKTHGYDDPADAVTPGGTIAQWGDAANTAVYNQVTSYIRLMGVSMNTDPEGGTTNDNNAIHWGVRTRLDDDLFDVNTYYWTNQWAPIGSRLGGFMAEGGIAMICYGRYITAPGDGALIDRDGGHCVALTKVDRRPWLEDHHYTLNYANPSNSSNTMTQADFKYTVRDTVNRGFHVPDWDDGIHLATEMLFDDSDFTNIVDFVVAVFPKQTMHSNPDGGSISIATGGFDRADLGAFQTTTIPAPGGGTFIDAEMAPDRTYGAFLVAPGGAAAPYFYKLKGAEGEAEGIEEVPGALALSFGRDNTVYVLTTTHVIRYNIDLPPAPGAGYELARFRHAIPNPHAIACDDQTDSVLVLDGVSGRITGITADLDDSSTLPMIGWEVKVTPGMEVSDGQVIIHTGHEVGHWFSAPGAGMFERVRTYTAPAGSTIGGISAGDAGNVYFWFEGQNTIARLEPDAAAGYTLVRDGRPGEILGLPAHRFLHTSRSRTNFVGALHSGPGWYNLPTDALDEDGDEGIADCLVDFAQPYETLDFFDVAAFLALFSEQDPRADLNGDGLFDFFDVVDFLGRFSDGCD